MNSKLRAIADGMDKSIMLLLSEGQMSDYTRAKLLYPQLSAAERLIADKGYDSDEFRDALSAKGIRPCIPSRLIRIAHANYDEEFYRTRGRIETMFGRTKDWRRIAMCYDRAAHTVFSAICIVAAVIFRL